MRKLCLALTAVDSFRSGHAELLYDPNQANGVSVPTARRLKEAEFDQRSFVQRRMSADDMAPSVTRRLVEPDNLVPTKDDAALDTNEERYPTTLPSETAVWRKAVDFLNTLMDRKSRSVDVPHPEENLKTLGLHAGKMDINNFIRWTEDVRKYNRKVGDFHIFESSVEVLKRHKTPEEITELLLLLRTKSEWKGADYTARSLLSFLVLSYYDSPEALLKAWLKLRINPDDLYHLLYLHEPGTLWAVPETAIMWLRYNEQLVNVGVRGVMSVNESVEKLLKGYQRRLYAERRILPLLDSLKGKPYDDELSTAVNEFLEKK